MLSLVDLITAGTLPVDLAVYLGVRVFEGASFLIGALPGGGGKTTVMGALLACVSPRCALTPTDDRSALYAPPPCETESPRCYVCHEIGAGYYYAYLWDRDAAAFFDLIEKGHQIASNLHADTYEQCRDQLCADNPVSNESFAAVRFLIFLRVDRGAWKVRRTVETVWESDGTGPHRLVYSADGAAPPIRLERPLELQAKELLEDMISRRIDSIEAFRREWIESLA